MLKLLYKVFKTRKNLTPVDKQAQVDTEILILGNKIQDKVKKLFNGSLAIRQVDAGSDNACEQELVALSNAFYDIERFGIHFVASPKHADMLMVTGPITRNMAQAVKNAYECTPEPKIIVAVGDDAISGGVFRGSYAIYDKASEVIPVDYGIPGDPPSPTAILYSLLNIMETMDNEKNKK